MIKNSLIKIRKRANQYHTKLTYWEEQPGKPKVEMSVNFFGETKNEVEKKVVDFIAEIEKS